LSSTNYCPYCGAEIKPGDRFCNNCGSDLSPAEEDSGVKIVGEAPQRGSSYGYDSQPAAYDEDPFQSSSDYGSYDYGSQPPPPSQKYSDSKDNAVIALILAGAGCFFQCFILPIIGLVFAYKAKNANEEKSMVTLALVLNWIFVGLYILGTIGILVWVIVFTSLGYWSY
jgi:hypothetical protein